MSGRGGSDVARYFLSLGGKSETAAYKVDKSSPYSSNVGFDTYTYRINLDINLTPTTKVYLGSDGYLSKLDQPGVANRSEEHTSELQSLMRISYAVFCLK